jgi:hypothetical protein
MSACVRICPLPMQFFLRPGTGVCVKDFGGKFFQTFWRTFLQRFWRKFVLKILEENIFNGF